MKSPCKLTEHMLMVAKKIRAAAMQILKKIQSSIVVNNLYLQPGYSTRAVIDNQGFVFRVIF